MVIKLIQYKATRETVHVLYPQKIKSANSYEELINITTKILQENNPNLSTNMGIILYNNLWPDISPNGIKRDIEILESLKGKMREFSGSHGDEDDFRLLKWFIEVNLHQLKHLRWWEFSTYASGLIFSGIITLTRKNHPNKTSRLESIIARLRSISPLIKGEHRRLKYPVKKWVDSDVYSTKGLINYLKNLENLFSDVERADLIEELRQAVKFAISELGKHLEWLENLDGKDLPLKAEEYRKLIEIRKIGFSVEELEELGWYYLEWTQNELQKLVSRLDGETIEDVRTKIRQDHAPNFDEVISNYKKLAKKARHFLKANDLVTLPQEKLEVIETPAPLKKFLSIAAAGMPGKYDKDQTGYFFCTVHDDQSMLEEHSYAYQPLLISHESYPGHHLHGACKNKHSSKIRNNTFSHPSANTGLRYSSILADITEGWGLYTEEMMWKAGFENDPKNPDLKQRFLQINAMRWRAARIVIDTKLHTGRISFDEAVDFLIDKTGYHKTTAEAEVMMYSQSPGYFSSYLLGKHQLTELREQVGDKLTDKEFHDTIIYAGNVPFWFVKEEIENKTKK